MLKRSNKDGLIMYADDSFADRNTFKLTLIEDSGMREKFITYSNG